MVDPPARLKIMNHIDPITGLIVLVCGMVGLWLLAIVFSINVDVLGWVMGKIKLFLGKVEMVVIKVVLYLVAGVVSFCTGSAISLCLIIPASEMLL